jgi:hypothetical protein
MSAHPRGGRKILEMSADFRLPFSGIGTSSYMLGTCRLIRESEAFWCRLVAGYFVFLSAFSEI